MKHFKIGSKVRVVKVGKLYSQDAFKKYIGTTHEIIGVGDDTYDKGKYELGINDGTWWDAEELELVSPKAKSMQNKANLCKPMQDEVEITKKSVDYTLNLGKYKIFATVSDKGITLTTMDDHDKFWFCNSTPEMIKNMASLMLEASKLK
jgi:hypothetical protein